jgi:DNA-binding CsgD family transcriptional regulator
MTSTSPRVRRQRARRVGRIHDVRTASGEPTPSPLPHRRRARRPSDDELAQLAALLNRGELDAATRTAQQILAGAASCSRRDCGIAGALTVLAVIAGDEGRIGDAISLLRAAVARGSAEPGAVLHPFALLTLARLLSASGEVATAESCALAATAVLDGHHGPAWGAAARAVRARNYLAAGRLEDADVFARAAVGTSGSAGPNAFRSSAPAIRAQVALQRGDVRGAAVRLGETASFPMHETAVDGALSCWVHGRIRDASDGPAAAVPALAPLYDDARSIRRLCVEEPGAAPDLVRVALGAGDRDRTATVVDSVRVLAINNSACRSVAAAAKHAQGLWARDVALLIDAGRAHVHSWDRASAAEDAGVELLTRGARAASRTQLQRALRIYAQVGAERDAARVTERLRDAEARPRTRRAKAPTFGWGSVTVTEQRVAELVADGLTNRQIAAELFLSRHTVDFHLRQVFRKVHVRSRVQLTRLVLEQRQASSAS